MSAIQLISGQIKFPSLNSLLSDEEYSIAKAFVWKSMINENQTPTKWFKSTKKGTKVNFDYIANFEKREAAIIDLTAYVEELNKKYNCGFSVV